MSRVRKRGPATIGPSNIKCTDYYLDFQYPYGDGPWTWVGSDVYPIYAPITTWEEECHDATHRGPPYHEGGAFDKWSYLTDQYVPKAPVGELLYTYWKYHVWGHLPAHMPSAGLSYSTLSDFIQSNTGDPSVYGAEAWNKFRPTRSGAELGVFLGELKDVPRMLKTTAKAFHDIWKGMGGSRTMFSPKAVADNWLNTQFGWRPFLSDLWSFYKTAKTLDRKLKQLRRDNGRWIRRGGSVEVVEESETTKLSDANLWPSLPYYFYALYPYGRHDQTISLSKNVWFEGAFRYWIPGKPESWLWDAVAVAQIFGLQPSPSLVWELTPWSWLLDWCANVGDSIANMSSIVFDNLCAKYAYVMCHFKQTVSVTGVSYYTGGPTEATWTAHLERKSRYPASPFGFGLTQQDLTLRQWSILSALGITRLKAF